MKQLTCRECQKEFEREVYCSATCRTKFHNKNRKAKEVHPLSVTKDDILIAQKLKAGTSVTYTKESEKSWTDIKASASFL